MKKSLKFSALVFSTLVVSSQLSISRADSEIGSVLISKSESYERPLGVEAFTIYQVLKNQKFENNIAFSNAWIQGQLKAFDQSTDNTYKSALEPMVEGGHGHGIGMRNWLTDKKNVAWWDKMVRDNSSDEGYARVVALNAAFYPGSKQYLLTYGFNREFDPSSKVMMLNDTKFTNDNKALFEFRPDSDKNNFFPQLVKFGDPVRQQMFSFYEAYSEGKVSPSDVSLFNKTYVKIGGCAMAATDVEEGPRAARYLNALNVMSITLDKLGFKIKN